MTIETNDAIDKFASQIDLDSSSASVADGAFSISTDLIVFTNSDDAPQAAIVGFFDYASNPDVSSSINLYLRPINIQSTNDQEAPDGNFQHTFVGSFPVNDVTTNQYIAIDISLPNTKESQEYEVYIENQTGQTIQAGWIIYVTPKTIGPHA